MLLNYQQKQTSLNEVDQKFENIFVVHGLFGSLSNLAALATSLQKHHRVISVDLRNHGNSPHSQTMSYQEMAGDLFELADYLKIEHFSIVGHSMGGKVAMACALQQPERINKLVVVDIAPSQYEHKHLNVFKALQDLTSQPIESRKAADEILSKTLKEVEVRQFLLKSLRKKEEELRLQFNLDAVIKNYELISGWPEFNTVFNNEALFIKGANSDYILEKHQADILPLFPRAKAKIVGDAGHWLHAEKPKTFNRLVDQFFK